MKGKLPFLLNYCAGPCCAYLITTMDSLSHCFRLAVVGVGGWSGGQMSFGTDASGC